MSTSDLRAVSDASELEVALAEQSILEPAAITAILNNSSSSRQALDRVFVSVYGELKRLAQYVLGGPGSQTLNATALVHETYAKLISSQDLSVSGRQHFYALCGRTMRFIVIDHARKRLAEKRGGGMHQVTWNESQLIDFEHPESLLALDCALTQLETLDARLVELIHYRVFAGMELTEIAPLLEVGIRQLQRDWKRAQIWITEAMNEGIDPG